MTLQELLEGVDVMAVTGNLEVPLRGIAYDSRRVRAGDAFFALAGLRQDGARFVRDAVAGGAVAVVAAPAAALPAAAAGSSEVARVEVAEPRLALAQAANRLHGHPSLAMRVVAVTGTNGKTTTTWMIESILRAAGWSAGLIGTTGVRFAGVERSSVFTTPESPELQALLAEMREAGVRAVAMEVSSHALAQRRAWGLETDVCVFTNLTQDHLDYHGTMESYLDAKLMLFDGRNGGAAKPRTAVVNAGDPHAVRVAEAARGGGARVLMFGWDAEVAGRMPVDVSLARISPTSTGLDLEIHTGARANPADPAAGTRRVRLPMMGTFNALNAAAAYAAALALGLPPEAIERGLERLPGVPGRLERVDAGQPFAVVVDFAHTPDALERALAAVRGHTSARVLLVFGCGGDRDAGKRPRMGAVAARGADAVWVTNDNPRGEEPSAIAEQIVAGVTPQAHGKMAVELDRRAAIAAAFASARAGDIVLIAGKGHETTQTIGERIEPFDDRVVARELLNAGGAA